MDEEIKKELRGVGFLVYQGEHQRYNVPVLFITVPRIDLVDVLDKLGELNDFKSPLFLSHLIEKYYGSHFVTVFKYMLMNEVIESRPTHKFFNRDMDPIDTIKIRIWDEEKERMSGIIKQYLENKLILDRK